MHRAARMRFNVTLIDPAGERYAHFLFDIARYILHSLELLGHDCTLERNRCDPAAMNVLIGAHHFRSEFEVGALLGGARDYVVLQTELLGEGQINLQAAGDRLERVLLPLLRNARAVWDGLDTNVDVLAKQGIRAEVLRYGYSPRLEEIIHKTNKDIDFLFYGSIGPWRLSILQKLESLGYRVRAEFDTVSVFRNDLIARAEVILTMAHGGGMTHLPFTRIIHAVNNRCLVVGEGGYGQDLLEDVFVWTNEPKDLVELCRATRARKDRRDLAHGFYESLRMRPMTAFMAPLVARLGAGLSDAGLVRRDASVGHDATS